MKKYSLLLCLTCLMFSQLAAATTHQCKAIWQDSWFVLNNAQPVQMLIGKESLSQPRGVFLYRSHEIIYMTQLEDNSFTKDPQKIYFDRGVAPASISGIALDGDKLLVAFHDAGGAGSWLKSFSWDKIEKALGKSDNRGFTITEDNQKDYLLRDYPSVGQAADGIGRIYVTPDNHYVYGQYDSGGRKIYTWDGDGKALGWVDGTNDVARDHVMTNYVDQHDARKQQKILAIKEVSAGRFKFMDCSDGSECKTYDQIRVSENMEASDFIPFVSDNDDFMYFVSKPSSVTSEIPRQLFHGNNETAAASFITEIPDDFKGFKSVVVTGFEKGDSKDKDHVYMLKSYYDDDVRSLNVSSSRAVALFQCDYSGE